LAGSEDPEVRRVTPTLMSAIDRAVDLCAETLRFTREGPAALEISRFELAELVEEVGRAPGVEIEGDRQQLFRVFANLGQNAIEAGATKVEITARPENGAMVVEVADNGPGLAPRARERLFQPFAGSARPGGTGLGLAIARDLLHAHGGEINLASSTGEGTRFRMTLPLAQNTWRRES
jgi:signal transduction histidine kinase